MKKFMQSKLTKFILMFVVYLVILFALISLVGNIKHEFYINIKNQTKLFDLTMNLHKPIYAAFLLGGLMVALTPFFLSTSPKEKKEK